MTPADRSLNWPDTVESGAVVATECACTLWWLVPNDVGSRCGHCGEPMVVRPSLNPTQGAA